MSLRPMAIDTAIGDVLPCVVSGIRSSSICIAYMQYVAVAVASWVVGRGVVVSWPGIGCAMPSHKKGVAILLGGDFMVVLGPWETVEPRKTG